MMPRLEAEDSLRRAEATALGSGTLDGSAARRLTSDLKRRARSGDGGPGVGPAGRRADRVEPAALAAIGIGVTIIDRKAVGD